jgi:hypothetical protein
LRFDPVRRCLKDLKHFAFVVPSPAPGDPGENSLTGQSAVNEQLFFVMRGNATTIVTQVVNDYFNGFLRGLAPASSHRQVSTPEMLNTGPDL